MVGCLLLVLYFQNSSALSAAYGIAVTGTMAITSLLFAVVARSRWGWSRVRVYGIVGGFLIIDLSFLLSNLVKIEHGGWVPIMMAIGVYVLMSTWKRGRMQLGAIQHAGALPLHLLIGATAG